MASNRGVAYMGPGRVEIQAIDYPKLALGDRKCEHGVILKVVTTNICGSDQHMVRGRTTAPNGLILGHEITGEVIEAGRDVEFIKVGDLVSVPFNIACGRCRNCKEGRTGICLNVNPSRPGAAYGYVDMGGWVGGQAEYVMVAVRRFQPAQIPRQGAGHGEDPRPDAAFGHLSHRLPRRGDCGRRTGRTLFTSRAPDRSGWLAPTACRLLGAAVVIVGDMIPERLAQARSFGCETIDLKPVGHSRRTDRINHGRAGGGLRRRLRRLRSSGATARTQLWNGPRPC